MSNGNKQRIAIDMDEVLADTLAQFLAEYNREFGESITKAHLTERKLAEIIPADRRARLRHYALTPGFFRDIPLMAGSETVFADLRDRYWLQSILWVQQPRLSGEPSYFILRCD